MGKVDSIKKIAVAFGFGSSVSEYTGKTVASVLKEVCVKAGAAASVDDIKVEGTAKILDYFAKNYGEESAEPYDLALTKTHATVTFKKGKKTITPGSDVLYDGDKIKVTAEADEGYDLTTLTANGTAIESGDTVTVSGKLTVVATGTIKSFDLSATATNATVTVTKGGDAVTPGENALNYGDEITISAEADQDYELTALTVNGEDFTSGSKITVTDDVVIVATGTAPSNDSEPES